MLNKLDDFPVHQTPEPLAQPETSDRRFYDRTWFNGYSADGSYYFGIGMAIYPHLGIMDCAFSVLEKDGKQHCFYGSRRAPTERTEMTVGPFKIEVLEPLRRTRVTLQENESGLTCDLVFSSRTAPIQEARQTLWQGARRSMDATRFDQFGFWSGQLSHPGGRIDIGDSVCHGTKDRSWGVRGIGLPETGSAPSVPGGICFIWAPLFWKDHVSHAIFFDGSKGEALVREGLTAPLFESEAAIPDSTDPQDNRMATASHRVKYHPASRLAASAEIDLINLEGETRTIHLEPILKFQMKGLGYSHPEWGQGFWKGELAIGGESFDTNQLDLLARENLHVQQVVKASDGENEGIGVLEQIVIGPYAPAGFTEFFDGYKES